MYVVFFFVVHVLCPLGDILKSVSTNCHRDYVPRSWRLGFADVAELLLCNVELYYYALYSSKNF